LKRELYQLPFLSLAKVVLQDWLEDIFSHQFFNVCVWMRSIRIEHHSVSQLCLSCDLKSQETYSEARHCEISQLSQTKVNRVFGVPIQKDKVGCARETLLNFQVVCVANNDQKNFDNLSKETLVRDSLTLL
jgi:hypothetical protein